jgi:hypothetical protein
MHSFSISSDEEEKACRKCARMLPLTSYYVDQQNRDGHASRCKECFKEDKREYRRRATDDTDTDEQESKRICRPNHLYVMRIGSDINGATHGLKIGRSGNVEERARDMVSSLPFDMVVLATIPGEGHIETAVHAHLAPMRNRDSNAREWFRVSLTDALIAIAVML